MTGHVLPAAGTPPIIPPSPFDQLDRLGLNGARQEAAQDSARWVSQLKVSPTQNTDIDAMKTRHRTCSFAIEATQAWIVGEARHCFHIGKIDDQFDQSAWQPLVKAATQIVDAVRAYEGDAERSRAKALPTVLQRHPWLASDHDLLAARDQMGITLALLGKLSGAPARVKQVFGVFGGKVGPYKSAGEFLEATQDVYALLSIRDPRTILSESETKAVARLMDKWIAAVRAGNTKTLLQLCDEPERVKPHLTTLDVTQLKEAWLEGGIESYKNPVTGKVGIHFTLRMPATTTDKDDQAPIQHVTLWATLRDGDAYLILDVPALLPKDEAKVRTLVTAYYNALATRDQKALLASFAKPDENRDLVALYVREETVAKFDTSRMEIESAPGKQTNQFRVTIGNVYAEKPGPDGTPVRQRTGTSMIVVIEGGQARIVSFD
ncbi:MAG: hypothetical protein WD042_04820 [Phycisphaeraceae bacterium]